MNQIDFLVQIKNILPDIKANIFLLHTQFNLALVQDLLKDLGFVDESTYRADGNLIEAKMRYRGKFENIVIVQDR